MKLSSVILMGLVLFSFFSCSKGDDEITENPDKKEDVTNPSLIRNSECHAVDMGTSVLWAAGNLGADYETDSGIYYPYGKTVGYGGNNTGNGNGNNGGFVVDDDGPGTRAVLSSSQDAACTRLGGNWRMPTEADFYDLIKVCEIEWIFDYKGTNISGKKFTSRKTKNSIFFPAAGFLYNNSEKYYEGWSGSLWTSSYTVGKDVLSEYKEITAFYFTYDDLNLNKARIHPSDVVICYPIRAVCKK